MNNNITLRIGVLYPDRMRINGDYGNLLNLTNRCRWRGIEIETQSISLGDTLASAYFDLLLFGGGQDWRMQTFVADDLKKSKEQGDVVVHKLQRLYFTCPLAYLPTCRIFTKPPALSTIVSAQT